MVKSTIIYLKIPQCVAFHPNGNYIATGSADHSVRLWCATSGKLMRVFADSSECHLLAGFDNSAVQLWQLNQNSCRGRSFYRRYPQSKCPWELNNCVNQEEEMESDEEEGSDEDVKCSEEERRERSRARHCKYADNS